LDTNGNWVWADGAGSISEDWGFGISCDNNGNCYLVGMYSNEQHFGSITITGNDGDVFTAKHDSGTTSNEDETVPLIQGVSVLYNAYPNPFHKGDYVHINVKIADGETGILYIFNLKGQLVKSHYLNSGTHQTSISTDTLASGIYFYQLKTETACSTKKLVFFR
jgi:hypothetical protein